jgi:hypothetical protein
MNPPYHRKCKSITKPFTENDIKRINAGGIFVINGTFPDMLQCTITVTPEPISLTNKTSIKGE